MLPAVPSTSPRRSMSLAAASTAASASSTNLMRQHLRVDDMGGRSAGQQRFQVVGDHLRLARLGVPRGTTDVRGEHDVGHRHQRVVGGQVFADEVVEPGAGQLAAAQGVDQGVGVVQLGAGGVEEDDAVAHGRELLGADHPGGVGGHRRVHRDDVGLGEQLVEAVSRLVVVRVVGDDLSGPAPPAATCVARPTAPRPTRPAVRPAISQARNRW